MVSLARHAVEVARRLDPRYQTPQERADLQARAWGELANALRASDDLHEAERAFGFAFASFSRGPATFTSRPGCTIFTLPSSERGASSSWPFGALDVGIYGLLRA